MRSHRIRQIGRTGLMVACVAFLLCDCAAVNRPAGAPLQRHPSRWHGAAPDRVRFPSRDADLMGGSATIIDGYLFKPAGDGPFPAIVALHGCSGLLTRSGRLRNRDADWAFRLQGLGYVVLFPDSLTPRGKESICRQGEGGGRMPFQDRPRDAYGALSWLQSQPYVRKDRIALLGWSNGGSTVLSTIDVSSEARPPDLGSDFRLAVAFYPGCRTAGRQPVWTTRIPLSILIGMADDWTPAAPCISLAERARQVGAPVYLITYPEAHHGFDAPNQPLRVMAGLARTARRDGRATVGTHPQARADAILHVQDLLARFLRDGVPPAFPRPGVVE